MKAITSIIIFFIASGVFSQVQEWNWHDGGYGTTDYSVDCIVDASGNIIVTGNRKYGLNYDIRTMKFSPSGDTLWTLSLIHIFRLTPGNRCFIIAA